MKSTIPRDYEARLERLKHDAAQATGGAQLNYVRDESQALLNILEAATLAGNAGGEGYLADAKWLGAHARVGNGPSKTEQPEPLMRLEKRDILTTRIEKRLTTDEVAHELFKVALKTPKPIRELYK